MTSLDYNLTTGSCREYRVTPDATPAHGWARLFAADYEAGDVYRDVPAVTDREGNELVPATRELVRQGIVAEYEARRDAILAKNPPAPVVPIVQPHRVLKDTIMLRIEAAGKLEGFMAVINSLDAVQRFKWDQSSWFLSDNPLVVAGVIRLELDPAVILAPDPLAP